jgi:Tfp pilus assembly protein PilF
MATSARLEQILALLADDPGDEFLRYGLGMEYLSVGDEAAAVQAFRQLVAASPGYIPTYLMLGQTLQRLGREAEAVEVLRRGVDEATRAGNAHAAEEMTALLAIIE